MAITFNAATDGANSAGTTSLSFSHTVGSGENRLLVANFVGDLIGGNDDITSVTYNSVAMTLAVKSSAAGSDRYTYMYYLLNPSTGANNIVINCTNSHRIDASAADYAGVLALDTTTTNITANTTDTSLTTSLTTTVDNCWVILVEGGYNVGSLPSAGTNATRRAADTVGTGGIFDSNGVITPAGSYSMTTTRSSNPSAKTVHLVASFKPWVATIIQSGGFFMSL